MPRFIRDLRVYDLLNYSHNMLRAVKKAKLFFCSIY